MQRMSPVTDYIAIVWPRIWGVRRTFQANMDVPHALGRPMLAAEIRSPIRFRGPKPQLTSSLISPQTVLRGVPMFDAVAFNNAKLAALNLATQSPPRPPTGTRR
jgi:hypothetical protein